MTRVRGTGMIRIIGLCGYWASTGGGCGSLANHTIEDQAAIVRKNSTPEVLERRGDASAAIGDLARAEQYYAAAMLAGGAGSPLTRRLLRVCVADHRYRAAAVYGEARLREDATDSEIRLATAIIDSAIGEERLARAHFERLLESSPDNPDAHFAFGVLLAEDVRTRDLARGHFEAYLRLSPGGPEGERAREWIRRTTPGSAPASGEVLP